MNADLLYRVYLMLMQLDMETKLLDTQIKAEAAMAGEKLPPCDCPKHRWLAVTVLELESMLQEAGIDLTAPTLDEMGPLSDEFKDELQRMLDSQKAALLEAQAVALGGTLKSDNPKDWN